MNYMIGFIFTAQHDNLALYTSFFAASPCNASNAVLQLKQIIS